MSASTAVMHITIKDRGTHLREKLRVRLDQAAELRCEQHGEPVTAVTIHARENGWFDATWTTCCPDLEQRAVALVKDRC